MSDYDRVAQAMAYLVEHATDQPTLEEVAAQVHLSPYHFQRLFSRWAGTTPKRFLQALTLERGKRLLAEPIGMIEISHELGLSGSSRLHEHFVQLEAVTPGEYRSRGEGLNIDYGLHPTPFGPVFVALTQRGICRLGFVDESSLDEMAAELEKDWPASALSRNDSSTQAVLDSLFHSAPEDRPGPLSVYVKGTNFQIAVWRALLHIPAGALASYVQVAAATGRPTASRAVGNAIGANPVALLIPCHRVIQQSGALGGYRWGAGKKQMLQAWERARYD
ncbi:bifunctional transcriptional activator/DNA repair enzyme AdaA [Marinimicrobium sp. C2-29]|uniref:bifunctional transcriptional activator/DNA repair enzyme AdaA n=1 Tax=Marinimicrobium sp. C2-29 TaxID=3139825 RepID=UPI0031387AE1